MDELLENFPNNPQIKHLHKASKNARGGYAPCVNERASIGPENDSSRLNAPQSQSASGSPSQKLPNTQANDIQQPAPSWIKHNPQLRHLQRQTRGHVASRPRVQHMQPSNSVHTAEPKQHDGIQAATSNQNKSVPQQRVPQQAFGGDDTKDLPAESNLPGDRGRTRDECVLPGDAVQCDKTFLKGIRGRLEEVTLLWIKSNICAHAAERLDMDPMDWRREGRKILDLILPEIARLATHPELFGDERTRTKFLKRVIKDGEWLMRYDETIHAHSSMLKEVRAQETQDVAFKAPWQSWCRHMPLKDDAPLAQEYKAAGLEPVRTQILPTQGLLIVEHWKQQLDAMVSDMVKTSSDAPQAESQRPITHGVTKESKVIPGIGVTLKMPTGMPQKDETTSDKFAFGKQETMAEMARFMAQLGEDDITRLTSQGMFRGTFLSDRGKQALARTKSKHPAEDEERDL